MKYVRMMDGRLFDQEGWEQEVAYIKKYYPTTDIESLIYKQDDTIDRLIDLLVIKDNDIMLPFIQFTFYLDDYRKLKRFGGTVESKSKEDVYACTWNFGKNSIPILTPVAKLNKKGDLELL